MAKKVSKKKASAARGKSKASSKKAPSNTSGSAASKTPSSPKRRATEATQSTPPNRSTPTDAPGLAAWADDGRKRVIIDAVRPHIDGGRFPIKRVVGESVEVEADIICDSHDEIAAEVLHRAEGDADWRASRMRLVVNDLWTGSFDVGGVGFGEFTVRAWVDRFGTWVHNLKKRVDADQDVTVELEIGAAIVREAAQAASGEAARTLRTYADGMTVEKQPAGERARLALADELESLMAEHGVRHHVTELDRPVRMRIDRPKALFSAWYEMFPRSASAEPGRHGTFDDVVKRLPYVAEMGFDVLYLPPIHPIGETFRKGPNNSTEANDDDPGSCWAIGSKHGGHKSIHPELGSMADFERLVKAAGERDIEIALDIAFQCSPDHPWVTEHPNWFKHRPDGTIQYAENPPKKYQDIYPIDFETKDWESLWRELKSVFEFWIDKGVLIFRVDNPHTKNFAFWEWCIGELQREHPDVIFLSEAFTRPKRMYRLAKAGFTQSYTYFSWRNGPWDLEQYMYDLTRSEAADFFRPNFWPNTPDILTEYLQTGGRPAAMARLVLAATLSSSYGIYGPVYELCDFTPRYPGSEENLDSEKYQVRHWNLDNPWSLSHFIALVNRIRRENPALQQFRSVNFHRVDNPALVAYSKRDEASGNTILCCVSTNPHEHHFGNVHLDLSALGIAGHESFDVRDLLTGQRYVWRGERNLIGLGPGDAMAHIFQVTPHTRSERDFEYFD